MAGQSEAPLVAVLLPRAEAAAAVGATWDRGDAVCVLDPEAPPAAIASLLATLRPTHVLDGDGRRQHPDGVPVLDGTAAVVTTSGTTSAPKLVELTVAGARAAAQAFAARCGSAGDDRWLLCTPLQHLAGIGIVSRARHLGNTVVVHPGFDEIAVASALEAEEVTHLLIVPTMLRRLLDAGAPLHRARCILIGAAATPPAVRNAAEAAGAPVFETYGASETWGGAVYDGVPLGGIEVRIAPNGEVEVRGPTLMRGYRFDPERTAAAFTSDGWYRTGDLGAWDVTERLRILGRIDDLIITGGVNVSPTVVEFVLAEHPEVADVSVVGRPDDEWGERVVAFVVPRDSERPPTLEDLRSFGADRLTGAQLPRELVLVKTLPRTAMGKVQRHRLP